MINLWMVVNDLMRQGYTCLLTDPTGQNFHSVFQHEHTPKQMFALGVFEGKYMKGSTEEVPADWFEIKNFCPKRHDPEPNCIDINSLQPISV